MASRAYAFALCVLLVAAPLCHASRPVATSEPLSTFGQSLSNFVQAVKRTFGAATSATVPDVVDNSAAAASVDATSDNAAISVDQSIDALSVDDDDVSVASGGLQIPNSVIEALASALTSGAVKPAQPAVEDDDIASAAAAVVEEDNVAAASASASTDGDNSAVASMASAGVDSDNDDVAVAFGSLVVGGKNLAEAALVDALAASEEDNVAGIAGAADNTATAAAAVSSTSEADDDNVAVAVNVAGVSAVDNQVVANIVAKMMAGAADPAQSGEADNEAVARSLAMEEDNIAVGVSQVGPADSDNSAVAAAAVEDNTAVASTSQAMEDDDDNIAVSIGPGVKPNLADALLSAAKDFATASEEDNTGAIAINTAAKDEDNSAVATSDTDNTAAVAGVSSTAVVDEDNVAVSVNAASGSKSLEEQLGDFVKLPFSLPSILTQEAGEEDAGVSSAIF